MQRFKSDQIEELVKILKNDGVISVPTDTVYGVCAQIQTKQAQEKLREVKQRPKTKAFPIMCKDIQQASEYCLIDERAKKIMEAFMPGPLTVILKVKEDIEDYIHNGNPTLAVRLATSKTLEQLLDQLGCPIFLTSANQSGAPTCTTLEEIAENCPLLDGMLEGEVSFGQASTIVDLTKEEIQILRQGPITLEQILAV